MLAAGASAVTQERLASGATAGSRGGPGPSSPPPPWFSRLRPRRNCGGLDRRAAAVWPRGGCRGSPGRAACVPGSMAGAPESQAYLGKLGAEIARAPCARLMCDLKGGGCAGWPWGAEAQAPHPAQRRSRCRRRRRTPQCLKAFGYSDVLAFLAKNVQVRLDSARRLPAAVWLSLIMAEPGPSRMAYKRPSEREAGAEPHEAVQRSAVPSQRDFFCLGALQQIDYSVRAIPAWTIGRCLQPWIVSSVCLPSSASTDASWQLILMSTFSPACNNAGSS